MSSGAKEYQPRIVVFGIGGAGCNAVNNMVNDGMKGVDFIAANTDKQALKSSVAKNQVLLGPSVTGGLGAGAKPGKGKAAAEESLSEIETALRDCQMCFITAGMGGGTGTGGAPVVAEKAKAAKMLTVAVVTTPFEYEGVRRKNAAMEGVRKLSECVDTLIVISNQKLLKVCDENASLKEAFKKADEVLRCGVSTISDLVLKSGLVNLDFADVRTVLTDMGRAVMGVGVAQGRDRAREAAEQAMTNPLLDGLSLKTASGALVNISAGHDLKLSEVEKAVERVRSELSDDANIIFGAILDENLKKSLQVAVVVTGMERGVAPHRKRVIPGRHASMMDRFHTESASPESEVQGSQNKTITQERDLLSKISSEGDSEGCKVEGDRGMASSRRMKENKSASSSFLERFSRRFGIKK